MNRTKGPLEVSVAVNSGNTERHPRVSFNRVVDALTATAGPCKSTGWLKFQCPSLAQLTEQLRGLPQDQDKGPKALLASLKLP